MKIQVKMTARDIFDFSMYSAYPRIPMTRIRNTNVKIPANPEYALYMEKSKISLAVIFT